MASNANARADAAFNAAMTKAVGAPLAAAAAPLLPSPNVAGVTSPIARTAAAARPRSADEIELGRAEIGGEVLLDLTKVPLHDPDQAARVFRSHGFQRTATAIMVMAKRQNISRRYRETLSARAVAKILGVDDKWVTTRCFAGTLKAERRGTARLAQQGGDNWSIRHVDLRQFIIDSIAEIDIRKVDKVAFVDLLTAPAPQEGDA